MSHETGLKLTLSFCGDCGSALCKTADADEFRGLKIVFAGTLDGAGEGGGVETKPDGELWVKYRVPWLQEIKGAQQFQGFA